MKIKVFDDDPRLITDPNYVKRMGSFGTVAFNMNKALKELGYHAELDEADWVGKCGALDPQFQYKDKKSFYINVWETNNSIPHYLLHNAQGKLIFGLCDKITNIWRKYGFETETIYAGCDTDYWHQTKEKNKNQFVFCHINHSTVRSSLELTIQAFAKVFKNNQDVKLIIKDSSENIPFSNYIKSFDCSNIKHIVGFWDSDQIRDLYSESHVTLNLLRSASFGMPLLECSACDSLCLTGNVSPTNEIVDASFAAMIEPKGEIPIYPYIEEAEIKFGLKNYYGRFSYPEMPCFWDFDVDVYANKMLEIYNNWSDYKKIDKRTPVVYNWKWENSVKKLINILQNK
jgi:glycosyltransferase involved in cell wall biosynthesis